MIQNHHDEQIHPLSLHDVNVLIKDVKVDIGILGGRSFKTASKTYKMDEIVQLFQQAVQRESTTLNIKDAALIESIFTKINQLDTEANTKLNFLTRVLTDLRRKITGSSIDRRQQILDHIHVLAALEKHFQRVQMQQLHEPDKSFQLSTTIPQDLVFYKDEGVLSDTLYPITNAGVAAFSNKKGMQDRQMTVNKNLEINGKNHQMQMFGVFDGHGRAGAGPASDARDHLYNYLEQELKNYNSQGLTDEGIYQAIQETFTKLDKELKETHGNNGTTATVAFTLNNKVWVANVGDSRTLLVKDGTSIQLSEDAKLHDLNYKEAIQQRITEAKNKGLIQSGSVEEVIKSENGSSEVRIQINRYGRNDRRDPQAYSLGVAQTLGDKYYEGILSAEPNIIAYPLQEATGGYLVLACDGLWDVASTRQIGDAINEMDALELTYQKMAESLVYSAVQSGSTDNLSVIVAQL